MKETQEGCLSRPINDFLERSLFQKAARSGAKRLFRHADAPDTKSGAFFVLLGAASEPSHQYIPMSGAGAGGSGAASRAAHPSLPPSAKAHSLRRSAFPHRTRFAGLRWGPRGRQARAQRTPGRWPGVLGACLLNTSPCRGWERVREREARACRPPGTRW